MLGRAHAMLGEISEGYHAYSLCIGLKPRFAPGHFNRAILCDQQNNGRQAIIDLGMAIRYAPDMHAARVVRAIIHFKAGHDEEALADIEKVLENRNAPVRAWFIRANIRERMGKGLEAEADRRHGLNKKATDPADLVAQGVARLRTDPKGRVDVVKG